jgi:hypothetical protein
MSIPLSLDPWLFSDRGQSGDSQAEQLRGIWVFRKPSFHGGNDFHLHGSARPNRLKAQLEGRRGAAAYFLASISKHCNWNAVRSRGITFSAMALCVHSYCLSCSTRRFSAASWYSGATAVGSTSFWAKAGKVRTSETSATRISSKSSPQKIESQQQIAPHYKNSG